MNLKEHYNTLYKTSVRKISSDNYEIDPLIRADNDARFGISLLIKPPLEIKNEIQKFLHELQTIEPNQYYYPNTDIHITVLSIISCYEGFRLSNIKVSDYVSVIGNCLRNTQNMRLGFKGVTASPSCIMIQGFNEDGRLNVIRDNLRRNFKDSKLEQSMDQRYMIQTAHATVFRFTAKLKQKEEFLDLIEKYRAHDFGTFEVNSLELSYNDWYHREELVIKLDDFKLKNQDENVYQG